MNKKIYNTIIVALISVLIILAGTHNGYNKDDSNIETTVPTIEETITEEETTVPEKETEPLIIETEIIETEPEVTEPKPTESETTEKETKPEIVETKPIETEPEPKPTEPELIEVDEIVYTTGRVNVRVAPGTENEKIGSLPYGTEVKRTGIIGKWSRIIWEDRECYIHNNFVSKEKPAPIFDGYPISYNNGSVDITITKEWYCDTWCYIAHVKLSDYTKMMTYCANGEYKNGYQTTSGAAYATNAILAVNGDYSAPKLNYIVVRNGKIWNGADRSMWMPGVYSHNTGMLVSAWETGGTPGIVGVNTQELVDAGLVTDTFCFGPPMLQNGVVTVRGDSHAQRTFIGTNGNPGDIWIVVSDGRYNDNASRGLTAGECGDLLVSKGCTFGIPLDGGGSSTMVFNGEVLNGAKGNQRSVVDFLIIKK